jgi:ABC-type nitrate/sulfonate/bicarbonate transport system ATPase subunit
MLARRTNPRPPSVRVATDAAETLRGLTVTDVKKTFAVTRSSTLHVLSGIDLTIEPGSVVAVVGPSGCGKTTLLEIVCGLQLPDAGGKVELGGLDVTGQRGHFAYMPQRDALLPWRTALSNATLGLELKGVSRKEAHSRAQELFRVFNLAEFSHYYPKQLSIGMRQRVALLRTFLFPSTFMLLDEPFASLDAITRMNVHLWLMEMWKRLERTVMIVTHDIDEAIFLADRIIVLSTHPGAIVLEVEVPLRRPRTLEATTTEAFLDAKRTLLEALAQQVRAFLPAD